MSPQITTTQTQDLTRKAIALAVVRQRDKIIALLKKHGVTVDASNSDDELIVALLQAIKHSQRFRQDLKTLLVQVTPGNTQNFTGEDNFFFTGESKFFNADSGDSGGSSTSSSKTALGSFLSGNLDKILGTGLDTISSTLKAKADQKLADKALAIEAEKTKQAALAAQQSNRSTTAGLSTGAKVAIGVGAAAVIGLIIYLVVKK
jgi:hypothetical protein